MRFRRDSSEPMVRRISEVFGCPTPPRTVHELQFDSHQNELVALSQKQWSEIESTDIWYYQMNLAYVSPLQQDLFDYLFPAWLAMWREGQISRFGGPHSEADFYFAIDRGDVFTRMMSAERRQAVIQWIADAYIEGVDAWGGRLDPRYDKDGPDLLHGPLWSFHGLNQSTCALPLMWGRITAVETAGRAQWWLVLASGIAWEPNECPFIPRWTTFGGGGGVYLTGSDAAIYDHGYLPDNASFMRSKLSLGVVTDCLARGAQLLIGSPEHEWAVATLRLLGESNAWCSERVQRFLGRLEEPDLGGTEDV